MNFFLPINPPKATAQQQKTTVVNGRPRRYDPTNVRQAKSFLLSALLPHAPAEPMEGPLSVQVVWVYPWLRKHYSTKGLRPGITDGHPCETRPDCDNLAKSLFDAMTAAGIWRDDSQVAEMYFAKCYGTTPGICIQIDPSNGIAYLPA